MATDEEWEAIGRRWDRILELRARIETLEAASARYVQAPLEVAEPTPAPAGALKESLTNVWNEGFQLRRYAATEVLILVASWLQQRTDTIANGSQWADLLREEAGR
jgi:hypothetical protein